MAPRALAWWTCTSTWPLVASLTSCLNFSAPRPKAWSFDTGDDSRRTCFGWAVALATRAAIPRTIASIILPCLIGPPFALRPAAQSTARAVALARHWRMELKTLHWLHATCRPTGAEEPSQSLRPSGASRARDRSHRPRPRGCQVASHSPRDQRSQRLGRPRPTGVAQPRGSERSRTLPADAAAAQAGRASATHGRGAGRAVNV